MNHIYKISILFFLIISCSVSAETIDPRVNEFINIVENGTKKEIKQACGELRYAGISDINLYDYIEKKVLEKYKITDSEAVSWLIIALGFSGLEKYEPTLEKIIKDDVNSAYTKHAADSLNNIIWYEEWNPIISDKSNYNNNESEEVNHFANMLRSDQYLLMRIAAKRIHYQHLYSKYLLDILKYEIKQHYNDPKYDRFQPDTLAWMLKALCGSKNTEYRSVVAEVINNAKNRKIVKHAKKYMSYFHE